ncbi:uncharacterized protein LOC127835476 [Dreissena polymorpha]|uniref:uncharacterized protein LOC127835476 n=1 Tax=Dreissena polymorpha TaxID=45954 RepID=UPI002265300F|nr:uncharacterized protein LOC127835476 [Dreissena polymorpha]
MLPDEQDRQSVISSARRSNLQDSTPGRRSHPIHPLLSDTSFGINLNFETEGDPLDTSFSVEEPGHSANLNNSSNQLRGAKTTSKRTTTEHGAASNHRVLAAAAVSNDPSSSVKEQRQSTDVKPRYHQTRKEETATKHASKDTDNKIRVSGQTPTEIISHAADPSLCNGLQSLGGHHNYAPRSAQKRTSINSSLKLANGNESQSFLSLPSDTGTCRKNPVNKSLLKEKRRLEAENQSLKEEITCKQCHEHEIEMVFLPCGHVLTCESCGTKARTCFSCKGVIKGIAKFYSA